MSAPDAAERLAELRARVDRRGRGSSPPPVDQAALDAAVERVIEERDRRQAAEAARVERERAEALATGGPCSYCGIVQSWEHNPETDRDEGRWYPGPVCAWCEIERTRGGIHRVDADYRDAVLRRLLPKDVTKWHGQPSLAERSGFRWRHETPDAATSETRRWAYVDVDELATRLAPKPIEYVEREPCGRCGCASLWLHGTSYVNGEPALGVVETWTCHGCARFPDLADVIGWATGLTKPAIVSLGVAAERVLGVTWWATHPAGGAADPPRSCPAPFCFVDRVEAKRRAFEVFGRGDWAELKFRGPAAYEAARAAAGVS